MLLTNSKVYEVSKFWWHIVSIIVDLYSSLSNSYSIYSLVTDIFLVLYKIVYIYSCITKGYLSFPTIENRE